jgi:serine/threonine protein kinase
MPSVTERLREALAPDYRVEREIARGGMGIVFLAQDVALERPVAIKIIRPELSTARAAARFLREARLLATLHHPNVVPIYRAGEAAGFFFYVMEYVEGDTLTERLQRGALKRDEVLKLGRDVLDALDAVHAKGVVHRDLKPSNIFLTQGRAIISDFGIAKPSEEPLHAATTAGRVIGTLGYMAPEQAYGQEVTGVSDLYAVGAVLFESYTGRAWAAQMGESRPNWSGVPRAVVPLLKRALAFKYKRKAALFTAGGVLAGAAVIGSLSFALRSEKPLSDVAILPFAPGPGIEMSGADRLTQLTAIHLGSFARVADQHDVAAWWHEHGPHIDSIPRSRIHELDTQYLVLGVVAVGEGDTSVTVAITDRRGRQDARIIEGVGAG